MVNHVFELSLGNGTLCKEDNIVSGKRTAQLGAYRPHPSFSPVAPNYVSQAFSCNKSNTTVVAVLILVP